MTNSLTSQQQDKLILDLIDAVQAKQTISEYKMYAMAALLWVEVASVKAGNDSKRGYVISKVPQLTSAVTKADYENIIRGALLELFRDLRKWKPELTLEQCHREMLTSLESSAAECYNILPVSPSHLRNVFNACVTCLKSYIP